MFNLRFSKSRQLKALLTSSALAALATVPAQAQTEPATPVRQSVDANGVDLFRGLPTLSTPGISLGQEQGLSFNWFTNGYGWQQPYNYSLYKIGSVITVNLGEKADRFTISGSSYIPTEGSGTSLTLSGTIYTYLAANGTVIHFQKNVRTGTGYEARAIDVTDPSGETLSLTYGQAQFCSKSKPGSEGDICLQYDTAYRLAKVSNNYGYGIGFAYENDWLEDIPPDFTSWYKLIAASGYNAAISISTPLQTVSTTATDSGGYTYLSVTDPLSRITTYRSTGATVWGVKLPSSSSEDVTYAYASGRVSSITTAAGTVSYSSSDASGERTVTVTDALSHSTVYKFDIASERMKSVTNALGKTTSWQYDSDGRTTRITQPEGNYTQFTYDSRGNVTETRKVAKSGSGLADIVTTASYPSTCTDPETCNRPTSTTDALGNVTDYAYDSTTGQLTSVTAPAATSGAARPQTRFSYTSLQAYYDKGSGIVASGTPVTRLTGTSSCSVGSSCSGTDNETVTTIDYGPQTAGVGNNLLPVTTSVKAGDNSISATTARSYDSVGNLVSVDGPLSGTSDTVTYRYDEARQRTGVIAPDPDGSGPRVRQASKLTYNPHGLITKTETGTVNGTSNSDWSAFSTAQQKDITYDAADRPIKAEHKSGGTTFGVTQVKYDAVGRIDCRALRMNPAIFGSLPSDACTAGTAGSGANDYGADRITRNSYDNANRVIKVQTAYGASEQADEVTTAYTDNGTTAYAVDAESNRTGYGYDGHDRLVKTEYPSTTKGANAVNSSDYEQLTYNANGNVTNRRLRDGNSIGYGYDHLNRLVSKDLPGSEPDATYGYDLMGHLTSAVQNGQTQSLTYDALGQNRTQTGPLGTIAYGYTEAGQRRKIEYPGASLYVIYEFDATSRVTTIKENNSATLASYAYDNIGRRTSVTFGNGVVQSYGFDVVSRMTTLTNDFVGSSYDQSATLTYNPASQIDTLSKSNDLFAWNGHYNTDRVSAGNGLNQLIAATPGSGQTSVAALSYDSKGNLTGSGSSSYTYSSENFLKAGPASAALDYDPIGRLYSVAGGSGTTKFQYDGPNLIAEYDASNNLLRRYVHGPGSDNPILQYEGTGLTTKSYLTADERGSIIAVTNGSGSVTSVNTYDEFGIPGSGNASANNGGRFQYTGQTWLPELGMYYYKARIYSPFLGRFMQTDPIGYEDSMNWYNYVSSDPVNRTDPTGLSCGISDYCKVIYIGSGGYIWIPGGEAPPNADGTINAGYWIKVRTFPLRTWGQINAFDMSMTDSNIVVSDGFTPSTFATILENTKRIICAVPPIEVSGGADAYLGVGASASVGLSLDIRTLQIRGSVGATLGVGFGGGVGVGAGGGTTETGFAMERTGTVASGEVSVTVSKSGLATGTGPKFGPQLGAWGGVTGKYTTPATPALTGGC